MPAGQLVLHFYGNAEPSSFVKAPDPKPQVLRLP